MSDHNDAAITVIGWDGAVLQPAAQAVLDTATLVIGGARHLDAAALPRDVRTITLGPLAPAMAALREHDGPAVVLASGDPGFFGIVRALAEQGLEPPRLRVVPAISSVQAAFARVGLAWDDALVASMHGTSGGRDLRRVANLCRAHPKVALLTGPPRRGQGVEARESEPRESEAQTADSVGSTDSIGSTGLIDSAGLIGSADSWRASAGYAKSEDPEGAMSAQAHQLAEIAGPRSAVGVSSTAHGVRELAAELIGGGPARPVPARILIVAQRLGEADECVERLTLDQAAERSDFAEPNVVLCLAEAGESSTSPVSPASSAPSAASMPAASSPRWLSGWNGPGAGPWAPPEAAFEHRDGQITKSEARVQILARLAPRPGDLIWDLGAGSGSVGIACARFGAAVVAVERDPESCDRISANAVAHGASVAVSVVCGSAPEVLARLPRPDAVFVGGGGLDVVRAVLPFQPRSVVVALAAVERVGSVAALLESDGREVGGVLLQSSRLAALPGGVHRFAAQNPVFLVWGDAR